MSLQNLTDVHTGRHAQRVQHNVHRSAIRQERHILLPHDTGNDTLVTMTAGHLITHGNLTLLGDVDTDHLIYARVQLIVVLTAVNLYIHDAACLTVRHTEGGITHLTGLLAEDGTQEALLGRQLGLALRGNLAHQDITGTHLGTLADNTHLVQILKAVIRHVRNVTGNLLRPQLGITGLAVILLNMDRGINIPLDQVLAQQDSILVVVAFPRHVGYDDVVAQSQLAVVGRRAVSNRLHCLNLVPLEYNRKLVDAGALVGAQELLQLVLVTLAISSADNDVVSGNSLYHARTLGQNHNAGVTGSLVLHAGTYQRCLGTQQRHSLTLHVGTHQGTVGVIVFQEWNHGCCNGYHLLW